MSRHTRGGAATLRWRYEMSGFTVVPRWTLEPVPGVGKHEVRIPDELVAASHRLANELAVPLTSVLLAAHAKVLGALSGERKVYAGYAVEAHSPLPIRMTLGPRSWREVLLHIARAESDLLVHSDVPVDDRGGARGLAEPLFETVFDVSAGGGELPEGTVLRVAFVQRDGFVLRLQYRTEVLGATCAARIAGYHLTALSLMTADPDAEHARASLLSDEELHYQLHGLAGPRRMLPDRRAHQLFEERARAHPDAIAAVHGNRQLTYRTLDARANQLARALLARGLARESVVGVVTERNLDWMTAVLAIFKAGGVYLPFEPHFPPERIARMLSRAGCRLVLTERGSSAMLDRALQSLSGVETLFIDAACAEGHSDSDPGVNVWPQQLSYIYFTSGSTGQPKCAICEQACTLTHLLSCLKQHPRELPDLRCVVVTGEALKKELVQRWFAVKPAIKLVNAYGLTETSDDTNHEIMDSVPRRERVPIGRPINNVRVYVVDEHLSPVPLGAPGEIVFSGICVGRGYINDRERTQRAFLTDPHHPYERLYRSGDYGRWLPEGKLEFLGRRDTQVKVSGFRIEIGEIENALLRVPGVREDAVVVTERADRGRHLVAFYSGERPVDANALRERLSASLPQYIVPTVFHWRNRLPLTDNGKIDKRALAALAAQLDVAGQSGDGPGTPTEHRLAAAWAEVLGVPKAQIGRRDHFFDRGGTSLSALKLAVALDRVVSLKDLIGHPMLADQADLIDSRLKREVPAPVTNEVLE